MCVEGGEAGRGELLRISAGEAEASRSLELAGSQPSLMSKPWDSETHFTKQGGQQLRQNGI